MRIHSDIVEFNSIMGFDYYLKQLYVIIPLLLANYYFFKLYTPKRLKGLTGEVATVIKSNALAMIIYLGYLYLSKDINYSRLMLAYFVVINSFITSLYRVLLRLILRKIRKSGYNIKRAVIVGISETSMIFLQKTLDNPQWGYNIIAIFDRKFDISKLEKVKKKYGKSYIPRHTYENFEAFLEEKNPDEIIIGLKLSEYDSLGKIINICEKSGIRTLIIPDYLKYIPASPEIEQIDDITIINIRKVPLDNIFNAFIKRAFDIMFSIFAIIITSPIMLALCILIPLESKGGIIYSQTRIGYKNREFQMHKFRSMKLQTAAVSDTTWTTKNDARKTKLGALIRKTNLDELPQFFNVLKGDMSVVGPRPERPYFVGNFKEKIPKYMIKHQVRPGITGWAQVNGYRGDTSIKRRIEYDLFYIENWTFTFDIKIILKTIFGKNRNAY